jgi:hypothetical protein
LLLDEPSEGLAPMIVDQLLDRIGARSAQATRANDRTRRAKRRFLARARRPRVYSRERRGPLLRARG